MPTGPREGSFARASWARLRRDSGGAPVRQRLTDGLSVLVELRHDWSPNSRPFAVRTGRPSDDQQTLTFSLVHEF